MTTENEQNSGQSERSGAEQQQLVVMLLESLQALRDMTKVQCSDGNWNYDPYMHGMANGMIFALSLFEAGEPQYLEAPDQWLKDLPATDKVRESSAT